MLFIKESNDALLDHISIEEQQEIIINGTPNSMAGFLQVNNSLRETVKVRSIALTDKAKNSESTDLNISWKLFPGEKKLQPLNFSLSPDTPPGEYIRYLEIGGREQRVKLVVQPNIEIDVSPITFTLQNTSPGTAQSVIFTVTNTGNMPFQIPEIKHIAALDMDFMCRAFGFAFRDLKASNFNETLNSLTHNIKQNLTDWASAKVQEAGEIIEPGISVLIHLDFLIPKNADQKNDYSGNIRFWDKDLSFIIKSHIESNPNIKKS